MISDTKCSHHVSIMSLAFQSKDREATVFNAIDSCIGLDHWPILIADLLKIHWSLLISSWVKIMHAIIIIMQLQCTFPFSLVSDNMTITAHSLS